MAATNLEAAVQCAMESCAASVHAVSDQFRGVAKLKIDRIEPETSVDR